jgi:hypothetical protein
MLSKPANKIRGVECAVLRADPFYCSLRGIHIVTLDLHGQVGIMVFTKELSRGEKKRNRLVFASISKGVTMAIEGFDRGSLRLPVLVLLNSGRPSDSPKQLLPAVFPQS